MVAVVELEQLLRMTAIELQQEQHARKRIEGNCMSMHASTCVRANARANARTCAWERAQVNKRTCISARTQTLVCHSYLYINATGTEVVTLVVTAAVVLVEMVVAVVLAEVVAVGAVELEEVVSVGVLVAVVEVLFLGSMVVVEVVLVVLVAGVVVLVVLVGVVVVVVVVVASEHPLRITAIEQRQKENARKRIEWTCIAHTLSRRLF